MGDTNVQKNKCKRKKIDFRCRKENAICSLYEVEHFLCNIKKICNTFCLYKILKWIKIKFKIYKRDIIFYLKYISLYYYTKIFFIYSIVFSTFSGSSITTKGSSNFILLSLNALFSSPSIRIFTELISVKLVIVFTIE